MIRRRSSLAFALPLALLLACGSSGSNADKGAGSDACGYDADFCAAAGKSCGSFGVVDHCGAARTVQCGDCKAPLSCGGGGTLNVCGASCDQGCPASFACNESGVCAGGGSHGLVLDVKSVAVSGKVTLDGGPLGMGARCAGAPTDTKLRLDFEERTAGASFSADVPCDATDAFKLSLGPGTYRVTASTVYSDASSVPSGTFVLDPGFVVKAGGASSAAFDVKTAPLSGTLTLDGGPLGTGTHCASSPSTSKARVSFTEVTTGASFSADVSCGDPTDSFSVRAGVGSYRAVVTSVYDAASSLPSGTFALATPVVAGSAPVKLDVKTASLSGKVTLDGGPLGVGAHCTSSPTSSKLRLDFLDAAGGGSFSADVLCGATDDAFSLRLAPGTYRVTASTVYDAASNVPSGTFVLADALVVGPTTAPAALDVKTASFSGRLTLNGGPLGGGAHCTQSPTSTKVRVTFSSTGAGGGAFDADVLCSASDDSFSLRLAPGTYSVSATSVYSDASSFPPGTFVVSSQLAVPAQGTVLDLKTIGVDGRVTLNAGPLGVGARCASAPSDTKVRLELVDASSAPRFSIFDYLNARPVTAVSADVLCSAADAFALQIAPGTYRVTASSIYSDASSLPSGTFTAVGRIDLH